MKHLTYAAVAAMALGGLGLVGCEKEDTSTASRTTTTTDRPSGSPAVDVDVDVDKEKIGNKVQNAAERTGDAVQRGAEKAGDALATGADKAGDLARNVGRKVDNAVDVNVNNTSNDAQTAGARAGTAAAPDAEGIRGVLAQVTKAALTKGGLDDVTERLVDADRNRLGAGVNGNFTELDGRVDQFLKDWQAKYGQAFDIANTEVAFPAASFTIAQRQTPQDAAGATVDVDRQRDGDVKVDVDRRSGVDQPGGAAADANRNDPGRKMATVRVAASHGMPDLSVPMIHEAPDQWKIDVPDTLSAEKLRTNVLAHLTAADNPAQWPADVNQAYALVSHHVLMALMDKPAK